MDINQILRPSNNIQEEVQKLLGNAKVVGVIRVDVDGGYKGTLATISVYVESDNGPTEVTIKQYVKDWAKS